MFYKPIYDQRKKWMIFFLCFLLIFTSVMKYNPVRAATYTAKDLISAVKELESLPGYTPEGLLHYMSGEKDEFTSLLETSSFSLKNIKTIHEGETSLDVSQLLKGMVEGCGLADYQEYVNRPGSVEFLTAMDEYNIGKSDCISDSLSLYYDDLTNEKRITKFVQSFYRPANLNYEDFKQRVQEIHQSYGISGDPSEYLYKNLSKTSNVTVSSISLSCPEFISIGDTANITMNTVPWNADTSKVSFVSDYPEIATIDEKGVITGISKGKVTFTATIGDVSNHVSTTIIKSVRSLDDRTKEKEIMVGESFNIDIKIEPDDMTYMDLTFSSSNSQIASVDQDGKVTGMSGGYATITATALNGKSISHEIKVIQKIDRIEADSSMELICGENKKINYSIYPSSFVKNDVVFESEEEEIVSVDTNGILHPKKNGEAIVILSSESNPSVMTEITVTVITKMKKILPDENQVYYMDHEDSFKYHVYPETTSQKELSYEMKENEYARMDGDKIIPKKIGQTELVVRSTDGTNLMKKVTIYIRQPVKRISVKDKIYLKKGETFQIYYTLEPANSSKKTILLKSRQPEIVAISNTKVVAKNYGKAKIILTADDPKKVSTSCYVIVERPFWHYVFPLSFFFLLSYFVCFCKKRRKKTQQHKRENFT